MHPLSLACTGKLRRRVAGYGTLLICQMVPDKTRARRLRTGSAMAGSRTDITPHLLVARVPGAPMGRSRRGAHR